MSISRLLSTVNEFREDCTLYIKKEALDVEEEVDEANTNDENRLLSGEQR